MVIFISHFHNNWICFWPSLFHLSSLEYMHAFCGHLSWGFWGVVRFIRRLTHWPPFHRSRGEANCALSLSLPGDPRSGPKDEPSLSGDPVSENPALREGEEDRLSGGEITTARALRGSRASPSHVVKHFSETRGPFEMAKANVHGF